MKNKRDARIRIWKQMCFSGHFWLPYSTANICFKQCRSGSGVMTRSKNLQRWRKRPKTRVNYRRRPIPISNRFTIIIFVSEYETVCARYVCSSLLSAGMKRGREYARWRTADDCIISLRKSRYDGPEVFSDGHINRRWIRGDMRAATVTSAFN